MSNENGYVTEGKKKPKQRRKPDKRPDGFQQYEDLVKDIFDGQNKSYLEWLHQKHQEEVLAFNLSNRKEVAALAREGE